MLIIFYILKISWPAFYDKNFNFNIFFLNLIFYLFFLIYIAFIPYISFSNCIQVRSKIKFEPHDES